MSEGWLGWKSANGPLVTKRRSETMGQTVPVWVQPLDPDGPQPGETWRDIVGRVEIIGPRDVASDGTVIEWWVRDVKYGGTASAKTEDLRPIPKTRTVTVELTEDEVDRVQALRPIGAATVWDKLAAALEDE